jgi:hypothetical protein
MAIWLAIPSKFDPNRAGSHLIGNLEAAPLGNGEVQAKTAFLVSRSHLETDHQLLPGYREDMPRKGEWRVEGQEAHRGTGLRAIENAGTGD